MDTLSRELVALILGYVDRHDLMELSLINRQFHALVYRILLRAVIIYKRKKFHRLRKTLALYPSYGQHIQTVQLSMDGLTDHALSMFTKLTPLLEMLVLLNVTKLTDASMTLLVRQCPLISSLKLSFCSTAALDAIRDLQGLRELELMLCRRPDRRLLLACLSLTKLRLAMCHDNQEALNTTLATLGELQQLTALNIQESFLDVAACMTMTWPHLSCLQLDACSSITDDTAIAFIRRHPHLVKLVLSKANLTDATLDAIAIHLPGIVHLSLLDNPNITSHGLRRLVQRCTDLVTLEFYNSDIPTSGFPESNIIFGDSHVPMYLGYLHQHIMAAIRLNTIR